MSLTDKKAKIQALFKECLGETIRGEISSAVDGLKTEMKAEIDTLREAIPASPRIRFDPGEARAPYVTTGSLGDRGGYSFQRVIQAQLAGGDWKRAKNEWGVHEMLLKAGMKDVEDAVDPGYWVTPLCSDYLPESIASQVKSLLYDGIKAVEARDVQMLLRKALGIGNDNLGGYLVEPQQAPEIIDLLRPQVVLQRAGALEIPLPPSGQLDWPRLNSDVDAQWVGESENIATRITTDAKFGSLLLRAKKLASFQKMSRELVMFGSPAVEALIRQAMARKIGEKEDVTWLAGAGTASTPLGIINTPSIISFTVTTTAANGDTIDAQDIQLIISEVGENNAQMEGWIMRPQMLGVILTRRNEGSTTTPKGNFVFDAVKDPTGKAPALLGGWPVHQTTQVSGTRIKGSGTTLTYILAGQFSEFVIGRAGTLEIRASDTAGTSFEQDQVWIRGISRSDCGLKHPAAIVLADQLLQS